MSSSRILRMAHHFSFSLFLRMFILLRHSITLLLLVIYLMRQRGQVLWQKWQNSCRNDAGSADYIEFFPYFFLEAQYPFSFRHFSQSFRSCFLYVFICIYFSYHWRVLLSYNYIIYTETPPILIILLSSNKNRVPFSRLSFWIIYYIRDPQKQSWLPVLLLSFLAFHLLLTYVKLYISF